MINSMMHSPIEIQPHDIEGLAPSRSGKPCILLVEDHESNRLVVSAQLGILGYEIDVAQNGFQALEQFSKKEIALVLMDLKMPGLDGYETTRRMRSIEASRGSRTIPIVAVTGRDTEEDKIRCLQTGMQDYLLKPYSLEQLQSVMHRHIASRPQ